MLEDSNFSFIFIYDLCIQTTVDNIINTAAPLGLVHWCNCTTRFLKLSNFHHRFLNLDVSILQKPGICTTRFQPIAPPLLIYRQMHSEKSGSKMAESNMSPKKIFLPILIAKSRGRSILSWLLNFVLTD